MRQGVTRAEERKQRSSREVDQQRALTSTLEEERLAYAKTWRRGIVICLVLFVGLCILFDAIPQIVGAAGMLLLLGPVAILILRPGWYVPGEYARTWRIALFAYIGIMMLLGCFTDFSFASSLLAFLLFAGPIALFVKRPRAEDGR